MFKRSMLCIEKKNTKRRELVKRKRKNGGKNEKKSKSEK